MPIDPSVALGAQLPEVSFSWTPSDVALYHLAVGAAADPLDTTGLAYVDDAKPKVLPTFATVAATFHATEAPRVSFPGIDIDLAKVVHGSQQITAHRPLPPGGTATTRTRIAELQDKGSAAVIVQESVTTSDDDAEPLWTARSSIFAKGEGGFGGERGTSSKIAYPDREPDHRIVVPTLPQQALLYRLCGDRNPLHSDPEFASRAGFPRPILHGLCSYGTVCRAVTDELLGGDVSAVADFATTFAGIVFPGETLNVNAWEDDDRLLITTTVADRDDAPALQNVVLTRR
ncbi:3-alpha,7-alpha,12-alpha-trihydroxy-5-beta-chole st-24-enoyl-CoAhydratase [Gordonia bronchialis DSM 43247]|uniref:3-alpha,7-alpha,12-alpha-trihydroxy-5-beta-chole st-24-enoyl-CoAhydratase n=1 Tax=Gordonia bronchialis (strain ATCC 25592 / DSM 43247 / BCRC 13721 / JCM 3198 / KCTC 3076 / NBRC 16047 / NCTC 10667) TaxID=526226 RepID=D0L3K7_GORB4|nr:MaoC/PaaZ C-terminal domain-containing protein [Gordonia bronchialis]ACY20206.1 3-alpha,7-alpha,12-alpha-trihydroxy-5-beta-chole st-24-enoyl-CoAhydratase [Gordonia bronchialis DSM 43247]MCC3322981.1 MaoC family dehydratase N-terminal domain-containing protein [Gordonia bronchialis]QGS25967.1 3-alpha,7-alpha,12-alpha-trihydroxy-5-beta-cholest-24-enoyl-CoA hydratase [Gordonia bronchialis]STQ63007.1 Enoyl reductase domain of yeast-type FAS1 [Gordonia bronchialis]